jgi:competence protein ComEA
VSRFSGNLLLIGFLLVILTFNMSRAFFHAEDSPVFLSEQTALVSVELASGFAKQGIHQYIDGCCWLDVIKMTRVALDEKLRTSQLLNRPIMAGQRADLVIKNDIIKEVRIDWMSAAKRVALGVPLHPDRMSEEDWQVLPGIGRKLAGKIEQNRQKYGEFGSLQNLIRVPGIGKSRLTSWNQYFFRK